MSASGARAWLFGGGWRLLLGWTLLLSVVWVVYQQRGDLAELSRLSVSTLVALTVLTVLNYVFLGAGHLRSLSAWSLGLRFTEWFGLAILNGFFDRLVPARGGMFVRLAYLNRRRGLPVASFTLSIVYLFFVSLLTLGLAGALVLALTGGRTEGRIVWRFGEIYLVCLLLGALGLWGPQRVLRAGARLSARLRSWQDAFEGEGDRWGALLRPRVIGLVMASYVGIFLTYALRLYLLFTGLGLEVTAFQCAVAGVVLLGVTAIPLVPGSLGIREMAIGWVAGELGMPALYGLTVGLIDRAVQLAVLLPLGAVFYAVLFRRTPAAEPVPPA